MGSNAYKLWQASGSFLSFHPLQSTTHNFDPLTLALSRREREFLHHKQIPYGHEWPGIAVRHYLFAYGNRSLLPQGEGQDEGKKIQYSILPSPPSPFLEGEGIPIPSVKIEVFSLYVARRFIAG
jgi:hypothetical protein